MVTPEGETQRDSSESGPRADRDEVVADRFARLPPAVPIAATVAVVGVVPTVPVGPEGAAGGGDGD